MKRGRFITLEGGEGTGKSTLQAALASQFNTHGIDVVCTREPGGTPLGEEIRQLVLHPARGETWSPLAQSLLMYTARDDHLRKKIIPALDRGQWVICDRFADSTRAYQMVVGGVAPEFVETLDHEIVGETQPDLTLVLDAPPVDVHVRRRDRGGHDVFETRNLTFHSKIRQAFLDIASTHASRCVVLDALESPNAVKRKAWVHIQNRFAIGEDE